MIKGVLSIFVVSCLLLTTLNSFANSNNVEKFRIFTEEMPPYNFSNDKGLIKGINTEIIRTIFSRAQIAHSIELYPWARSFKSAKELPLSGVYSTAKTKDRNQMFKWVGPLASSKGYIYKLASRKDIQINSIEEAKKYNLAIVRSDVYQDMFEKLGFEEGKNLTVFAYNMDYFELFLQGKVDLILGSDIVVPFNLKQMGLPIGILSKVIKIADTQGNFLALNKSVPDEVVDKLNKELNDIKASKEFDLILKKYTTEDELSVAN